ncbi:MAG: class I SAM-dependent rRNA methyltransferase, partial [Pseudomonadota bacterium]
MTTLFVRSGREIPVLGFHPWVFSGALEKVPEGLSSGDPVTLATAGGQFLARGYFNSYSQIAVRIWSWDPEEEVDGEFFVRRVKNALAFRQSLFGPETDAYRLVNAESDLLPGLVVDRYAGVLVVQFHTQGILRHREAILAALSKVVRPTGIWERSESASRKVEGLESKTGLVSGEVPDRVAIRENGLSFLVDVMGGQKTGFFLDQRENRQAIMHHARGGRVLNAFSYTGAFGVYALAGGAAHVVNVDSSAPALALARENAEANGFSPEQSSFVDMDVKKYLASSPGTFDLIILDPPAFIKDRKKKRDGLMGYRRVNE